MNIEGVHVEMEGVTRCVEEIQLMMGYVKVQFDAKVDDLKAALENKVSWFACLERLANTKYAHALSDLVNAVCVASQANLPAQITRFLQTIGGAVRC